MFKQFQFYIDIIPIADMRFIATIFCVAFLQWLCYFVSPDNFSALFAQCPSFQTILINSCSNTSGTDESEGEMIIFSSGGGFNVNDLGIRLDPSNTTIGGVNDNIGIEGSCPFSATQSYPPIPGCANVIFVGPGASVPPNSLVVLFMDSQTGADDINAIDWSGLCGNGEVVYFMQNGCNRTIGAFSNATGGSDIRDYSISTSGGCLETYSYDRGLLSAANGGSSNGAYYTEVETPNYGTNNCAFPPVATTCPAAETHPFEICSDGSTVSPAVSLSAAEALWTGASSVSFHSSMTNAMNNASPISAYSGPATVPVTLFARVVYPDGCVVIGMLTLNFLSPDGNAGNDATLGTCSNGSLDLLGALGGGISAGSFSDDDGAGVNLSNPSNVDFTGVSGGNYTFTYTANDDLGTPCGPDMATVTVNVTASPTASAPTADLLVCFVTAPPSFTSNLADITVQISGGFPLQYYLDMAGTMPIDPTNPADQATLIALQPSTIFANYSVLGCPSNIVPINVIIEEVPEANGPQSLEACESVNGFASFNLSNLVDAINGGNGNDVDFFFNSNGTGAIFNTTSFSSTGGTVFAIVTGAAGCTSPPVSINLTVNQNPEVSAMTTDPSCNGGADGTIDLTVSNGQNPLEFVWNPASLNGQEDPGGLTAGTYQVTVTDDNDCTAQGSFTLNDPPVLTLSNCAEVTAASGAGVADGTARVTVTGGMANYTVNYTGPTNGSQVGSGPDITLSGLLPGDYTVNSISDANGCTVMLTCAFTITAATQSCDLTVDGDNVTTITCFGADDGTITLDVMGNSGALDIQWSVAGFEDQLMATVGPGTYGVTVTDEGTPNCVVSLDGFMFTEPDMLEVTCTSGMPASTNTSTDGSGNVTFSGGTPPYTLDLSGPSSINIPNFGGSGFTFNNLRVGTYTVSITDANDCTNSCMFTVSTTPTCNLMVNGDNVTGISCFGANDGTITLDVTGNSGALDIQWSVAGFEDQLQATVGPGTYGVTVTDEGVPNCFVSLGGFQFTEPDALTIACSAGNVASAPLAMDGSGDVNFTGGVAPYRLILSGPANRDIPNLNGPDFTFDDLGVGTYTVNIIDANNCENSCFFTVTSAGCPLGVTANATDISCNGDMDGAISLVISGNNGAVTVDWDQDQYDGQQDLSNLTAGAYNVTVTDAAGCNFPLGPIVIAEPDVLMVNCTTLNDVSNPNAMDGRGRAIITGGTAPYQVILRRLILNTSVNDTFALAMADTLIADSLAGSSPNQQYEFVVVDANGCRDTCDFSIFEPPCPNIFVNETITNVNCPGDNDGRIEINAVNAQEPISYSWTPTLPDTNVVSGLAPGNYQLILTDSFGCTFAAVYPITGPDSIVTMSCMTLTDETTPGAMDGSAAVTIMGDRPPFMIDVFGPTASSQSVATSGTHNLNNLSGGTYQVLITDNSGCPTDTCSFVIDGGSCDMTIDTTITPADCSGMGQIAVSVNNGQGPFTFDWSDDTYDGQDTINVPTGFYAATITDVNGCTAFVSEIVEVIDNAPRLDISSGLIACQEDTVDVMLSPSNGTPAYTYHFTTNLPSSPDIATSSADTIIRFPVPLGTTNSFTVRVDSITDANGCSTLVDETINYTVSAPDTVRFNGNRCIGDTITLEGRDFFVGNPSDTFFIPGGTCGLLFEVDYTFGTPMVDTLEQTLCPSDSLVVGGVVFNGNNLEGLVDFGVPAVTGCDSTLYVRINYHPIAQGMFSTSVCEGDTVFVGNDFYTVDDPSGISVLDNAASTGCDSLVLVSVNFIPTASVMLTGGGSICLGDSINLTFETANGGPFEILVRDGEGNSYDYGSVTNGNSFPVAPDQSTIFTLVSATQGGAACPVEFSGEVSAQVSRLLGRLDVAYDFDGFQITCNGAADGRLVASVVEGISPFTYTWADSTTGAIRDNLGPGNYEVTITDSVGCQRVYSETLQEPAPILADPFVIPPGCNEEDGRLRLDTIRGGVGPYEVTVDGTFYQAITSFPYVQNLAPGNYNLEIRDMADCAQQFTISIPHSADPVVSITEDTMIVLGDSLLLIAQTNFRPDSILWEPAAFVSQGNQLSTYASPTESMRFRITVSDSTGCRATANVLVSVDERVPVYIPTGFSPNGDGVNDVFRIFGDQGVVRVNTFRIFTRWGEMVYQAEDFDIGDPRRGWDGKHRGEPLDPQVLVYYANVSLTDGRKIELKGDLTLIR